MGHRFAQIAFTESVRHVQARKGSRAGYAAMEQGKESNRILSEQERQFIAERDSFYMATVSESGWPYVQHRGGPPGFLKVLDEHTLGFADFRGNRQYLSVGNLQLDDRVSLILMDYPNRRRLKLLGRVRLVGDDQPQVLAALETDDYRASVEHGLMIQVEAFDWNCPQHITPRHTDAELRVLMAPIEQENRQLRQQVRGMPVVLPEALGDGPLALEIHAMRQLTPAIRTYELRRVDGGTLPAVEPGAHLQVPVPIDAGRTALRSYSIVSVSGAGHAYSIAVARDDRGRGGSRAVHQHFELGVRLHCSACRNHFRLHDDLRPAVLVAGGIGITPLLPMARALAARGSPVAMHFAGRALGEMAFLPELREALGERLYEHIAAEGSRLDLNKALAEAAPDALVYVCGPERLVQGVLDASAALGMAPERIRVERFGTVPGPDARPVQVELQRSGTRLEVPADRSVLDVMLDAGVDLPFSCRSGVCRSCAVRVVDGTPEHHDSALTEGEWEGGKVMLPCVSRALSPRLVLDV